MHKPFAIYLSACSRIDESSQQALSFKIGNICVLVLVSIRLGMFFDRESTVVVTKLNNLSEAALTNYCQNFGKVVRCFIKVSQQTPRKEPCK